MPAIHICTQCREPFPQMGTGKICSACLAAGRRGDVFSLETMIPGGDSSVGAIPLPPPPQIAGYEITGLLGQGGMGAVYEGVQKSLNRRVAIKVLYSHFVRDPQVRKRFEDESAVLAKLNHPNIVTVLGRGKTNDSLYFIMEFMGGKGKDLGTLMRRRRLTPPEIRSVLSRICAALQFAHEQGIVHRDIKPGNVLIDRHGTVKLADFGIASISGAGPRTQMTSAAMQLGTPDYMSPEQRIDPRKADARSDIYSLGVMLYELLTGRLPHGVFERPSEVTTGLSPDWDGLVLDALQRDPARRIPSAKEFLQRLRSIEAGITPLPPQSMASTDVDWSASSQATVIAPQPPQVPPASVTARTSLRDRISGGDHWFMAIALASGMAIAIVTLGIVALKSSSRLDNPANTTPIEPVGAAASTKVAGVSTAADSTDSAKRTAEDVAATETIASAGEPTVAHVVATEVQTPDKLAGNERDQLPLPADPGPSTSNDPAGMELPKGVITNSIGMKLVLIPAGEYLRGSPDSDKDAQSEEKPQHRVRILKDFYLGQHEVTQGEWKAVMGTEPWKGQSYVKKGKDYPATYVSWYDAQEFCGNLSQKDGRTYRLPTEAEWEYAARGGQSTRYSFGDDESKLSDYAWWGGIVGDGNAKNEQYAHQMGLKKANDFGLYDMHGNVWEWCSDWYDDKEYSRHAGRTVHDPQGPQSGSDRVLRGGGCFNPPASARAALRNGRIPGIRVVGLGFRVAAVPSGVKVPQAEEPVAATEPMQSETPPNLSKPKTPVTAEPDANSLTVGHTAGQEWSGNELGMKFCWCPDGTFKMGSQFPEQFLSEPRQFDVTLSGFWMGKCEVTQSEWAAVMGTTLSQQRKKVSDAAAGLGREGDNFPMVFVSHTDATEFCRKLTEREADDGRLPVDWEYRLPTEAQWEYACRAGTTTRFTSGDDIDRLNTHAWISTTSEGRFHEVGTKQANAWGLHDMHGNVSEWCRDWYRYASLLQGGRNPEVSTRYEKFGRVIRGGDYSDDPKSVYSARRRDFGVVQRSWHIGFRVAVVHIR